MRKPKGGDPDQDKDLSETERAELERLRKENTALRMERDFAKNSGLVREGTAVKYAAIANWAAEKEYSVTFMCDQLGVVRQGYYRWRSQGPCERERTDAELADAIGQMPSWTEIPACAGSGPSSPRAGCGSGPSASGG